MMLEEGGGPAVVAGAETWVGKQSCGRYST